MEIKTNNRENRFARGKITSGVPQPNGSNKLPKEEYKVGITKKKIIKKACIVTVKL